MLSMAGHTPTNGLNFSCCYKRHLQEVVCWMPVFHVVEFEWIPNGQRCTDSNQPAFFNPSPFTCQHLQTQQIHPTCLRRHHPRAFPQEVPGSCWQLHKHICHPLLQQLSTWGPKDQRILQSTQKLNPGIWSLWCDWGGRAPSCIPSLHAFVLILKAELRSMRA